MKRQSENTYGERSNPSETVQGPNCDRCPKQNSKAGEAQQAAKSALASGGAGINAEGLPADLDCHHLIVNSWEDLEAPQNVCIGSIPTVFNPRLAPPGKALVHAYTAGNEPYSVWEGLDRNSEQYRQLKVRPPAVLLLLPSGCMHS